VTHLALHASVQTNGNVIAVLVKLLDTTFYKGHLCVLLSVQLDSLPTKSLDVVMVPLISVPVFPLTKTLLTLKYQEFLFPLDPS
jgi:hypothetical protein